LPGNEEGTKAKGTIKKRRKKRAGEERCKIGLLFAKRLEKIRTRAPGFLIDPTKVKKDAWRNNVLRGKRTTDMGHRKNQLP